MELIISDAVAEKIWKKENRRIRGEDVQQSWKAFLSADHQISVFDSRNEHETWPPTEWVLVRLNRQILKLVFIVDDEEDAAYLKTAFYVDQKTIRAYLSEGGIIYG